MSSRATLNDPLLDWKTGGAIAIKQAMAPARPSGHGPTSPGSRRPPS